MGEEELKLLFFFFQIGYLENSRDSTKNLSKLASKFNKVDSYKQICKYQIALQCTRNNYLEYTIENDCTQQ